MIQNQIKILDMLKFIWSKVEMIFLFVIDVWYARKIIFACILRVIFILMHKSIADKKYHPSVTHKSPN